MRPYKWNDLYKSGKYAGFSVGGVAEDDPEYIIYCGRTFTHHIYDDEVWNFIDNGIRPAEESTRPALATPEPEQAAIQPLAPIPKTLEWFIGTAYGTPVLQMLQEQQKRFEEALRSAFRAGIGMGQEWMDEDAPRYHLNEEEAFTDFLNCMNANGKRTNQHQRKEDPDPFRSDTVG